MSITIEKNGPVWTVIHSRPESKNAMDPESAAALYTAFIEFENDDSASVAVLWGEGGAFCAGYDLKHAATIDSSHSLDQFDYPDQEQEQAQKLPRAPMGPSRLMLDKPVIAAISGPAVAGGMELAMWCDIRVMEQDAYMGVFCRRWGVPLVDGGTVRLERLVGHGRALDLILTGRRVEAKEAAEIGLCEYVVEHGAARFYAEKLAAKIASFPQGCLRADRRSAIRQHGLSIEDALKQEWINSRDQFAAEGVKGAAKFASGLGRGGEGV